MSMNEFKNMKNNICYYSDTDSCLMKYKLPDHFVSSSVIGMMKLEYVIKEGYIIAPKLYAFKDDNNNIIMKAKGVKKGHLTFDDFKSLSNGNDVTIQTTVFLRNLSDGTINIITKKFILKYVCGFSQFIYKI